MVTTFQRQEPAPRVVLASAVALMVHYFNIREVDAWTEVLHWAGCNPPSWIRVAVIEALYQGRYKVISVQQILDIWRRRGRMLSHFNREFEAIVTVPLPDRVQAHLRSLAQEHQEEHRQQRLRDDRGFDREQTNTQHNTQSSTQDSTQYNTQDSTQTEMTNPSPGSLSVQLSPAMPTTTLDSETVPSEIVLSEIAPSETVLSENRPSPIVPLAPEPRSESRQTASSEDRVNAPGNAEVHAAVNFSPATTVPTPIPIRPDQPNTQETEGLATLSTLSELHPAPKVAPPVPLQPPSLRRSSSQIDQFCPTPDRSGFDRKLLALANQS